MSIGTSLFTQKFLPRSILLGLVLFPAGSGSERVNGQSITATNLELTLTRPVWHSTGQGLRLPTNFDTPNDGSGVFFVTGLAGRIDRFNNGAESTFLDISSEVIAGSGSGMLGMVFHPGYSDPLSPGYRKLYTFHSTPVDAGASVTFSVPGYTVTHHNVVTEWQASASNPNVVDISTRREIYREAHPNDILHNGGALSFGPDGYMYITTGSPPGAFLLAQSLDNINGKVLRIDPLPPALTPGSADPISANGQYRVPASNPFVSMPSAIDEIYALGLRNPYRMNVDPESGLVFLGDVGQGSREEVDAFSAGANLGWPYLEGTIPGPYDPDPPVPTFTDPIAEYTHADGRSVTGGHMYHGSIPELQGKYIFAEFSFGTGPFGPPGRLFWIDPFDGEGELKDPSEIKINEFRFSESTYDIFDLWSPGDPNIDITIYSLGVDDDGEIYILGEEAQRLTVYKIVDARVQGDFDNDTDVDGDDLAQWQGDYGQNGNSDADADGDSDGRDFLFWQRNYGMGVELSASTAVPEPGTLLLALAAMGALAGSRRRRMG